MNVHVNVLGEIKQFEPVPILDAFWQRLDSPNMLLLPMDKLNGTQYECIYISLGINAILPFLNGSGILSEKDIRAYYIPVKAQLKVDN
jgi:hypothetical protein